MPSASVAEHSAIAPDLKCSGCGNPTIKDGQFKCLRCSPHRLVLATLNKQDIACPRHERPVVLMRYDRKSDQYRAHCQKRGCPNYVAKVGTLIRLEESEMTQEEIVQETRDQQAPSKTQELRDWLDAEIERNASAEEILEGSLNHQFPTMAPRYRDLIHDELGTKREKDRSKLEELQKRLEVMSYIRGLDVDVDELERWGFEVAVPKLQNVSGVLAIRAVLLGQPRINIFIQPAYKMVSLYFGPSENSVDQGISGEYNCKDVRSFEVLPQGVIVFTYPSPKKGIAHKIMIDLKEITAGRARIDHGYTLKDKKS